MSDLDISQLRVISCVSACDLEALKNILDRSGYAVFELHGSQIRDETGFLRQVNIDLPQPEGLSSHNWSAFSDCLWDWLTSTELSRIAILWTDAHCMLEGGLSDLLLAVSCFEQAMKAAVSTRGFARGATFYLFLLGNGVNFPRLADTTVRPSNWCGELAEGRTACEFGCRRSGDA
jgi:hypothetical protein